MGIEALPLSTVQGKCIYKMVYVLNLVEINVSFHLSKVGCPNPDLSAIRAQYVLLVRTIYRSSVAQ